MDFLIRSFICLAFLFFLSSCQFGYYLKSSYNQLSILSSRQPIDKALQDPALNDADKAKLRLSVRAREFAESFLHLKQTKNYTSFAKLDRPFVTYVVNAAPKWELKHHQWSYLFVGKMPYKGYFNEPDAKEEQESLRKQDLDTYLRGVSAYSTLGWFNDPILSSMLRYKDHDLVNTVIHETVHATLYIKNSADFNERMAVFLGNKGTELFYLKEEGENSPTLQLIRDENEDERIFSEFISKHIKNLQQWYKNQGEKDEKLRQEKFAEIKSAFATEVEAKLKTSMFKKFKETDLNNARLMLYKTYSEDLNDFAKLYEKTNHNFEKFIELCKTLENSPHPEKDLGTL